MKDSKLRSTLLIGAHGMGTETTSDLETVASMI
jgi:hypothetical protein